MWELQLEAMAGRDEDSGSENESWGDELEKELADGDEINSTQVLHFHASLGTKNHQIRHSSA